MNIKPIFINTNTIAPFFCKKAVTCKTALQAADLRYMPFLMPQGLALGKNILKNIPEGILKGLEKDFDGPLLVNFKEVPLLNKLNKKFEKVFLAKIKYKGVKNTEKLAIYDNKGDVIARINELDYKDQQGYLRTRAFCLENENYKGAGKKLIQAAVEDSINNGCNGALYVFAYNNFTGKEHLGSPISFYLRQGFKFKDPFASLSNFKQNYYRLNSNMNFEDYMRAFVREEMILTPSAVEDIWKPIIKENPVFEETLGNL